MGVPWSVYVLLPPILPLPFEFLSTSLVFSRLALSHQDCSQAPRQIRTTPVREVSEMRYAITIAALVFGQGAIAGWHHHAKNFIYVVPDGYGPASQTMARDYYSMIHGQSTKEAPNSEPIGVENMVRKSLHFGFFVFIFRFLICVVLHRPYQA